ncbi:response regulator [Aliarcobacter cibarius]|jgi:two-component system, chemotaxis family, chemotaxis protein CheY|uniref:Response regulator n=1 Tax=Aliarcobacter cibarius TaxID=255507 RepID=A0A5J6RIJ1_9BACT|nr:response regulator [Aliarcobacter cibarius]QEZ89223.1 two-component system response regulator [Aliarcobacter cibarius]QKJ27258.1 two-component system response regulator [Aliarcobacter cibarius]TLT01523.1 response regulator [Aliarcobacter cibarius]TLT02014.1 response regulator [Aliarcobacter cibarius]TLT04144.1 response regulator [Aliarcobacter cibarius]
MKILVTDDSKMARKMVLKTLEDTLNFEYEVFEATNGQEAVDLYKTHKPNLVLMDLTMPVMDGFEALKRIKELESDANVVVISADIQKQAIDKALKLGAFNFIKKPIDSLKMKQILNKIIS